MRYFFNLFPCMAFDYVLFFKLTNVISNTRCSARQLQIREITISEITTTIFPNNDFLEEDSGFGEATHEEIVQFLNFMEGKIQTKLCIFFLFLPNYFFFR